MEDELRYRTDLYKGTAEYYDRFRPPYPTTLLDDLRARLPLGSEDRLLDLAAGTGQIAFTLAADVADVVAVDQESEAIEFGRRKAKQLRIDNIEWVNATAEGVALEGTFSLVAIGNAFHRLNRAAVANRVVPHLVDRGCVALFWSDSPWRGDRPWQRALADTLERRQTVTNARDRIPQGWENVIEADPHDAVLQRAGLTYEGSIGYSTIVAPNHTDIRCPLGKAVCYQWSRPTDVDDGGKDESRWPSRNRRTLLEWRQPGS